MERSRSAPIGDAEISVAGGLGVPVGPHAVASAEEVGARGHAGLLLLLVAEERGDLPDVVNQAERQLAAAGGTPITWSVAEAPATAAINRLFLDRGISGINVVTCLCRRVERS